MSPAQIPHFLLPRGLPTARTLRTLQQTQHAGHGFNTSTRRCFSESRSVAARPKRVTDKSRVLSQPDKFRPPSHPQRLVNQARTSPTGQPVNYGRALSAEERAAQDEKQYPNMFPPEGTVMFKFLTSRWIHIWIAMVRSTHRYPRVPTKLILILISLGLIEHPNHPRNIHLHHKLQSNLPLRPPPPLLVRPPHPSNRHPLPGNARLPHARATRVHARP